MAFLGRLLGWLTAFPSLDISEFMRDTLHWLPVWHHIHYRLSTIVWRCVLGIVPTYLLELFILTSSCTGQQSLCSASRGDFLVPHAHTAIKQHKAFSIVGPSTWNSLPSGFVQLVLQAPLNFYFRPGLGWERLWVVILKWRYINSIDR